MSEPIMIEFKLRCPKCGFSLVHYQKDHMDVIPYPEASCSQCDWKGKVRVTQLSIFDKEAPLRFGWFTLDA